LLFIFDAVGCWTTLDPDSVVIDDFAQCPFGRVFGEEMEEYVAEERE